MAETRKSSIELYRLLLRLQLLSRALTRRAATKLSSSESQVLGEIRAEPRTATRLARDLGLSKSTISRLLTPLVLRELVSERPGDSSRSKILAHTEAGTKELESDDLAHSAVVERIVSPLTVEEEEEIEALFRSIADSLGAPPGVVRPGERPLGYQQRRLARALGLFDVHIFGSEFSATEYHILHSLLLAPAGSDLTAIASVLPFDMSTLSRAVKKLEAEGLIERRSSERDKRRSNLTLSTKGYDAIAVVERSALSRIGTALAKLSGNVTSRALGLIERCVRNAGAPRNAFGEGVVFGLLEGEDARRRARSALVTKLVEEGRVAELPSRLFAQGDFSSCLHCREDLLVVADVQLEGKHWVLEIFEPLERRLDTGTAVSFVLETLSSLARSRGVRKVIVPPGKLALDVMAALDARAEPGGVYMLHPRDSFGTA